MITICQGIKCNAAVVALRAFLKSYFFLLLYKKFSFILMQIDLCKNLSHFRLLILTEKDDDIFFILLLLCMLPVKISQDFCSVFQSITHSFCIIIFLLPPIILEGQNDSFEISKPLSTSIKCLAKSPLIVMLKTKSSTWRVFFIS